MHKYFLNLLFLLSLFASISACSGDDADNPNVIVDEEGVKLEITWTNSAADPTDDTNLRLLVVDGFQTVFSTSNWNSFGNVEVLNSSLNNGTYALDVVVNAIDRSSNYTVTVTGLASGKSFATDFGPINANDLYSTLHPLSLAISGKKYTINN